MSSGFIPATGPDYRSNSVCPASAPSERVGKREHSRRNRRSRQHEDERERHRHCDLRGYRHKTLVAEPNLFGESSETSGRERSTRRGPTGETGFPREASEAKRQEGGPRGKLVSPVKRAERCVWAPHNKSANPLQLSDRGP